MTDLPILCAGSALWDIIARTERSLKPGFDVPGHITRQLGGVALNIALALATRGAPVALLSSVGKDPAGDRLIDMAMAAGIGCDMVLRTEEPTDTYLAIEDGIGEIFGAVADCAALERYSDSVLAPLHDGRLGSADAPWSGTLIIDGNFPAEALTRLPHDPAFSAARLALVPASPGKAERLALALHHPNATLYVNRIEAEILCQRRLADAAEAALAVRALGAAHAVVTDGARAAAYAGPGDAHGTALPPKVEARTTTGAGDAFLAAHLDAIRMGADDADALATATRAAAAHVAQTSEVPV